MIQKQDKSSNWKMQAYLMGALAGLLFGVVGAFLYTRAAEESASQNGHPQHIPTGQIIGLSLAALGLIRQVTELGKPKK